MVFDTIRPIIFNELDVGISEDDILLESSFVDDLKLDSLDMLGIIMAIEDRFEFDVIDGDSEKFNTVKDIVEYVEIYGNKF